MQKLYSCRMKPQSLILSLCLVAVTALWLCSRDSNGPLWRHLPTLSMPSNYLRAAAATPLLYGRCVLIF